MTKRKNLFLLGLTLSIGVFISSCYKDKEDLLYPNSRDCSNPSVQKGAKFTAVESIIQSNCVSCHSANGTSPNLSTPCTIVDNWSNINNACVVNQTMPQSGPLSSTDQQAITDWVNAGHLYTN